MKQNGCDCPSPEVSGSNKGVRLNLINEDNEHLVSRPSTSVERNESHEDKSYHTSSWSQG
jgi:hypothetical protein